MKLTRTFLRFFKSDADGKEQTAEYLVDDRKIYNLVNPDGSALGFYFFDIEVDEDNVILNERNRFQVNVEAKPLNVSGRYYFNGQVYSKEELAEARDVLGEDFYKALMEFGKSHYVKMMDGRWQEFDAAKDKVIPNALFDTQILELKARFTDPFTLVTGSMERKEDEHG